MLQMLRTTSAKIVSTARTQLAARKSSPYTNYMCYRDGQPYMVINAPSLEHAQFIVSGFSCDHTWMLMEVSEERAFAG